MYIVYKTATTGLWDRNKEMGDATQDRMCGLAWCLYDDNGAVLGNEKYRICKLPEGVEIPVTASRIHGITNDICKEKGKPIRWILGEFLMDWYKANYECVFTFPFDLNIISNELYLDGRETLWQLREKRGSFPYYDLMEDSKPFCGMKNEWGKWKAPKMFLAYELLTGNKWGFNPTLIEQVNKLSELFQALKRRYNEQNKLENQPSELPV